MEEFAIRPAYGKPDLPLIEFRGDHRSARFPAILPILETELRGFGCTGSEPVPDDFLWECEYDGGTFEISDDWGGLFIIPRSKAAVVAEQVAAALVQSGCFKQVPWWGGDHGA